MYFLLRLFRLLICTVNSDCLYALFSRLFWSYALFTQINHNKLCTVHSDCVYAWFSHIVFIYYIHQHNRAFTHMKLKFNDNLLKSTYMCIKYVITEYCALLFIITFLNFMLKHSSGILDSRE